MTPREGALLRGLGERGRALAQEAAQCLAAGRSLDAVDLVSRARRAPLGAEGVRLALVHADALLGLRRHTEAVHVSEKALRRQPTARDVRARLRLQRGQALWKAGRAVPGRSELRRGAEEAEVPLTSARAHELNGAFCAVGADPVRARRHLEAARHLYEESESTVGLARVLESEERLARDAGRLGDALELQERRLELLGGTSRVDLLAGARSDRGCTLTLLGRFAEARRELEEAAALFRGLGDPREISQVALGRAAVHLAEGECEQARDLLTRACQNGAWDDAPGGRAEALLLLADAALAEGDRERAGEAALAAVRLFGLVEDRSGLCRARARRAHALLETTRVEEAAREAERARELAAGRGGLEMIADLALGRALLRGRRAEAAAVFQRMLDGAQHRPDVHHTARLGQSLAAGCRGRDAAVEGSIRALEAWGDRRLLAVCLADVRSLTGEAPLGLSSVSVVAATADEGGAEGPPFRMEDALDAARALVGPGKAPERWAAAMRALRPALPFFRAVMVGGEAWEIRSDRPEPRPLAPDDIARALAPRAAGGPVTVRLSDAEWSGHASRVIHRLGSALLVPLGPGRVLYLDTRDGEAALGERGLDVLARFAPLVDAAWPDAPVPPRSAGLPGILGECPAMRTLVDMVHRFARTELPVHVTGETGTGKEAVAAAVHRLSRRGAAGAFVSLNASTYDDEVFQSEMFGHVRGAFTGASPHRDGLVTAAHGGTLFIDEVADLSPVTQSRLLRFLQEKEFRRLGENTVRHVDVRLVTATNVPLEERVGEGRFRQDLLYRLNALVLTLPPLRDRGADILLLAEHFLDEESKDHPLGRPTLGPDVRRAFEAYPWPGNVRELQNEVARLVAIVGKGRVELEHLSRRIVGEREGRRGHTTLREALAAYERDVIVRTLELCDGHRIRTAGRLGLSRQALLEKMKRLGL